MKTTTKKGLPAGFPAPVKVREQTIAEAIACGANVRAVVPAPTFTPGPWTTNGQYLEAGAIRLAILESAEDNAGLSPEDAEGNANLIAAAPDLLDAAADALGDLDNWHPICGAPAFMDGVTRLRAAIAKAKGKS